jgi:hypothetical protein
MAFCVVGVDCTMELKRSAAVKLRILQDAILSPRKARTEAAQRLRQLVNPSTNLSPSRFLTSF